MLTNIETNSEKLVTLVLVGQPQLADRLNDERLGQLKQRIELRCTLSPFDLAETVMYIRNRVRIAGGDAVQMFTRDAIQVIHERSRGIPRSISVICENALVAAFAENQKPVTRALVQEICDELDLSSETPIDDQARPAAPTSPAAPSIDPAMNAAPVSTPAEPSAIAMAMATDTTIVPPRYNPHRTAMVVTLDDGEALVSRLERALQRRDREANRIPPEPDVPTSLLTARRRFARQSDRSHRPLSAGAESGRRKSARLP